MEKNTSIIFSFYAFYTHWISSEFQNDLFPGAPESSPPNAPALSQAGHRRLRNLVGHQRSAPHCKNSGMCLSLDTGRLEEGVYCVFFFSWQITSSKQLNLTITLNFQALHWPKLNRDQCYLVSYIIWQWTYLKWTYLKSIIV